MNEAAHEHVKSARDEQEWRPVPGHHGIFEATEDGQVRRRGREHVLTACVSARGYAAIATRIGGRRGKAICPRVHQLVAAAWVPGRTERARFVNHKDGDKLNNHAANLEWVTALENNRHARRLGLFTPKRGEQVHNAKLTEDDVRAIRREFDPTVRATGLRALGAKYGVCHKNISDIVHRVTWKHVGQSTPAAKEVLRVRAN